MSSHPSDLEQFLGVLLAFVIIVGGALAALALVIFVLLKLLGVW